MILFIRSLDDFIFEEINSQADLGTSDMWDWEYLKQRFASHIMVDLSYENCKSELDEMIIMKNY